MKHLKYTMIIGALFVLITGSLSHFLYDWTGQNTDVETPEGMKEFRRLGYVFREEMSGETEYVFERAEGRRGYGGGA